MEIKHPRTPHLPWSPGVGSDDKVIQDLSVLKSCKNYVISEKMDGENTSLTRDNCYARSLDSTHHESRSLVKALWAGLRFNEVFTEYPDLRICGENMYAVHSIAYENLESHFLVHSIWVGKTCLSWEDTVALCKKLGLSTVPVSYYGPALDLIPGVWKVPEDSEGYVVRDAGEFTLDEFHLRVAKYVRANHVQTDEHWMSKYPIIKNSWQ